MLRLCHLHRKKRRGLAASERILTLGVRSALDAYYEGKTLIDLFGSPSHALRYVEQGLLLIDDTMGRAWAAADERDLYLLRLQALIWTRPRSKATREALRECFRCSGMSGKFIMEPEFGQRLVAAERMKTSMEKGALADLLMRHWCVWMKEVRFRGRPDFTSNVAAFEALIDELLADSDEPEGA